MLVLSEVTDWRAVQGLNNENNSVPMKTTWTKPAILLIISVFVAPATQQTMATHSVCEIVAINWKSPILKWISVEIISACHRNICH